MKMNLPTVRVNKLDSCLTYALKRAGHDKQIKYMYARDIPKTALMPFLIRQAYIGQILVWESVKKYYLWATEITSTVEGKPAILMNPEYAALHFGVVESIDESPEGDLIITISDCVRNSNAHSFPTISLATICLKDEAKSKTEVRIPTYYLNL